MKSGMTTRSRSYGFVAFEPKANRTTLVSNQNVTVF
jgi:hypothetical protein